MIFKSFEKNPLFNNIDKELAKAITLSNQAIEKIAQNKIKSRSGGTFASLFILLIGKSLGVKKTIRIDVSAIVNLITQQHLYTDRFIDKHLNKLKSYNVTSLKDYHLTKNDPDEAFYLLTYLHGNICLHALYKEIDRLGSQNQLNKKEVSLFKQKMSNLMVTIDIDMFLDVLNNLKFSRVSKDKKIENHIEQGILYNMEAAVGIYLFPNISREIKNKIYKSFYHYGKAFELQDDIFDFKYDVKHQQANILRYTKSNPKRFKKIKNEQKNQIKMANKILIETNIRIPTEFLIDTIKNFSNRTAYSWKLIKNAEKISLGKPYISKIMD